MPTIIASVARTSSAQASLATVERLVTFARATFNVTPRQSLPGRSRYTAGTLLVKADAGLRLAARHPRRRARLIKLADAQVRQAIGLITSAGREESLIRVMPWTEADR